LSGTDCKPLLVFINRMSGGQQGPGVIQRLSSLLNPNQIIDIRQGMIVALCCVFLFWAAHHTTWPLITRLVDVPTGGPAVGLSMFMPLIEKANGFRILICGGDGTGAPAFPQ